jgi:small subunit ribosomal protein S21
LLSIGICATVCVHWNMGGLERCMEIKVFNNNVEKALKIAKKKLAGEGLFRELKRRRFYEKPSLKKKNKEREAQRRRQKWLAKHRV